MIKNHHLHCLRWAVIAIRLQSECIGVVEVKMDEARKPVLEKLSELLTSSWSDAKNPAQIVREIIPLNLEEAYYVQDRMHQLLDANISGWKVGATSPMMREINGHEDMIPGRIFCSEHTWVLIKAWILICFLMLEQKQSLAFVFLKSLKCEGSLGPQQRLAV